MHFLRRASTIAVLASGIMIPFSGLAQVPMDQHGMDHAPASAAMTEGEIRKVDQANGKVTIRHAEISNLDMPPMTMVFTVTDKNLLRGLKAGDQIRFAAVDDGGKLVVTAIDSRR